MTRRSFVATGVGSAVAIGAALDAAAKAAAAGPEGDVVVGRFVRVQGERTAVLSVVEGRTVPVTLDPTAFVVHGTDGLVDNLTAFVPGEQVVVRGSRWQKQIAAVEFQSLYRDENGILEADGADYVLVTSDDRRVRVPQAVVRDRLASVQLGGTYSSTIWVHPATGEATALTLDAES